MPLDPTALSLPSDTALCDRLIDWCAVNSGSEHMAGLDRMRGVLREAFGGLPAEVDEPELGAGRPRALRVRCRPQAPVQVLLNIHFDTVYGADHSFQRCERAGPDLLRGPGVADAKGGILVLMTALQAFERLPVAAGLGWEVLLGPDEEIGSPGSEALYRATAARHRLAMVFEPARENGDLVLARKGTGTLVATCHGRAAHAAKGAEEGRNAILTLAEFVLRAARVPEEYPEVSVNIGRIRGGTATNIVPDLAVAELDVRCGRRAEGEGALARLRELAGELGAREGYRCELAGGFHRPPLEATPANRALFAAYQECGRALGLAFGGQSVGGGSDGNLFAETGLPVLDGLGPVGGALHSEREWIRPSSLAERARLAALFLAKVAGGEIALPERGPAPPR